MRQKTNYQDRPAEYEVRHGNAGESVVLFRENIAEIDGGYEADEYCLVVRSSDGLEERVAANLPAWKEHAIAEDYAACAKAVRAERDSLIAATDYLMESDYPITPERRQAVAAYRQALRDVPQQSGFPYDVVFPEKSF